MASEIERPTTRSGKAPLPLKLSYGAGQLVEMVVGSMLNIFMLFYATAVCGLPGGLAGLALGAGLAVDALMDPLIGSLSDGWRTRFGRRAPFMILALPLILGSFNLLFSLPSGLSEIALFVWLTVLSLILRISLSLFTLPYQALGVELTDDYVERSSIAAWRWAIGLIGTTGTIVLGYGVFLGGPDGALHRRSYGSLTLTLSAILLLGGLSAIRVALKTRGDDPTRVAPAAAIHARLFREMGEVFANPVFRLLLASSLLVSIAGGLQQALTQHVASFFWLLTSAQIQPMALAAVAGLVLGAPLSAPLASRVEKRTMMIIGMVGSIIGNGGPTTLRLLGLLPLTGNSLAAALSAASFVGGVFFGLTVVALLAIIPDAADEHEHRSGARREGLYFAGYAFANKAATGAGILIAGIVLSLIAFPSNVAQVGGVAAIPIWKVDVLAMLGGPGAALLSIAGIALMLFYRIDKRTHARILVELYVRRAAAADGLDEVRPTEAAKVG